eukprot:1137225-Pelagomonas_calceolata.AAC.7
MEDAHASAHNQTYAPCNHHHPKETIGHQPAAAAGASLPSLTLGLQPFRLRAGSAQKEGMDVSLSDTSCIANLHEVDTESHPFRLRAGGAQEEGNGASHLASLHEASEHYASFKHLALFRHLALSHKASEHLA